MAKIHLLDSETIDKIAAGEVVERPASVVKELVENAMDASATSITVEIRDGGIEFIRVTDNGSGMEQEQIRNAFMRHATSKIRQVEDLMHISSLGFRGEALSSISAVAKVELISKTADTLTGTRIYLEGGKEIFFEEIGAPEGTTFIVKNLFYNTPVRRKFLKTATTEAGYISDLMEHLALSRPDIAFQFIVGKQTKFYTSGNGDLKEVIYRIYGKEISNQLIPIQEEQEGIRVEGYLGKPICVRANRGMEIYFLNGRYVQSQVMSKAIEEGYKEYLMQHKFPVCFLHITMDPAVVDVNVHPTKMDVRFSDNLAVSELLTTFVSKTLSATEMIPRVELEQPVKTQTVSNVHAPEPFEFQRKNAFQLSEDTSYKPDISENKSFELFQDRILSVEHRKEFQIIGQVFATYWLVEYKGELLIIDQHAAHEKVYYERLMKHFKENKVQSQQVFPPVIVPVGAKEASILQEFEAQFVGFGFEFESFGGNEYALRAIPSDLYGCDPGEMFLELLNELSVKSGSVSSLRVVEEKIASMACKSAVKGRNKLSEEEAEVLIDELLTLDNPYHCPHGRPTIVSMSQTELEKKFKRIVN